MKKIVAVSLCALGLAPVASFGQTPFRAVFGSRVLNNDRVAISPLPTSKESDALHLWNQIAIDATGRDHKPTDPTHIFGEQVGPSRAARAEAIVHLAMFDALNAKQGKYRSFAYTAPAPRGPLSEEVAIAQAARDTLVTMYPSQQAIFDSALAADLANEHNAQARAAGIALGQAAAAAVLATRVGDHSDIAEPTWVANGGTYSATNDAGIWRQDPVAQQAVALGAHWGEVRPFVMTSSSQFRLPPPPAMNSDAYTAAFNEVKALGGDNVQTPSARTEEQTFVASFWAYDGTPSLCAPPRLYNQVAVTIADKKGSGDAINLARLLALVNVAMADAAIASWESKFYYQFWRPVCGIRESDPGIAPSFTGDGNPNTVGDPGFMPLGAPASNLTGPNFTPPFPAYPSGHATFGGAIFQVLRRFYGTDQIRFTFVSDEWNGTTRDNNGEFRPYRPRTFQTLSQAEAENAQSRIYLGIHWSFDASGGITMGRQVGDWVFDHILQRTQAPAATGAEL
jgi:membrane-associated phospholipid phosphatase